MAALWILRALVARETCDVARKRFRLVADVSTDDPKALRPILRRLFRAGPVSTRSDGFRVECEMIGKTARDLNRALLSELRRIVKKTRLRAQWTTGKVTERFFDYVSKGSQRSS